jgi:hypothetical protein
MEPLPAVHAHVDIIVVACACGAAVFFETTSEHGVAMPNLMPNPSGLVLLFVIPVIAYGTSIAIIRTDREIVIATDSRAHDLGLEESEFDVCKIRNAGPLNFTFVGQSANAGVDFKSIAERALRSSGTLDERIGDLVKELRPHLEEVLQTSPEAAALAIKQGSITSIAVYGLYEGRLTLEVIMFPVSGDGHLGVATRGSCPGRQCQNGRFQLIAPKGTIDTNVEPIRAVRAFVESWIDKGIPSIGGPIEVLRIDRSGKRSWNAGKPSVCKDQP